MLPAPRRVFSLPEEDEVESALFSLEVLLHPPEIPAAVTKRHTAKRMLLVFEFIFMIIYFNFYTVNLLAKDIKESSPINEIVIDIGILRLLTFIPVIPNIWHDVYIFCRRIVETCCNKIFFIIRLIVR